MLIEEFKITRKLLSGAAMLNQDAVRTAFVPMPSAQFRTTFRLNV